MDIDIITLLYITVDHEILSVEFNEDHNMRNESHDYILV
jgi:hypothetical protein